MEEHDSSGHITVRFPDEMKVDAPKTDNLIHSLTQAFSSLSKMLQGSFREIADALQTLKHLPELVRGFQEEVTHQFTNLFTHQIETQMLARQANILAARKKREIADLRQQEKMEQIQKDKNRIVERYSELISQLNEESQAEIRELDSHAFEIVEEIYPGQIQEKFSFDSTPAVEFLAAHADASAAARGICLEEGIEFVRGSMQRFLDQREGFYSGLAPLIEQGNLQPGWYEVPFLVVETEDISTGETSLKILLDPALTGAEGISEAFSEQLHSIATEQLKTYSRLPLDQEDRTALADAMCEFGVPEEERARFETGCIELLVPAEVEK